MDPLALAAWAIGLAAVAAVLGGWYWWAANASKSARSVTQASRRLAQGDLGSRAAPAGGRPAREMSNAFNRMAQAIQTTIQTLSGERDKLSELVATMADGVVVMDAEGQIVLSNSAAAGILGLRHEQLQGRRFSETVRDHQIQQLVSQCAATGQPQSSRVELRRPRKFLNVAASPLLDLQSGDVLLTIQDFTSVQQAEAGQREFVSNVSHELRNPLAAIKAIVETLESGTIEDEAVARDFLGRISQDVDRMSKLVDDLLELSRLESGQLTLRLGDVAVACLLREVTARFQPAAAERGIILSSDAPDGLPALAADADRLRQVLINLLENALRFTPSGGSISLAAVAGGGSVEFRVADTGVGIAPEHLPHVFERFYKVDRSRRSIDYGGGTGLGLAIARQIIEAHGGSMTVTSEEGAGSVFFFSVPVTG